ncbi:MAG: ABC transporter permease [Gammaproteobacteria bacterium]|nr:ABC transporter permease [Gammaproteobacteria bacterium]
MLFSRLKDLHGFTGFGLMAGLCLAFLYAPIMFLLTYSFNAGRSVSIWSGFSFRWYEAVFNNSDIQAATMNSLIIAVIAASVATLLATGAAIATVRHDFRGRQVSFGLLNFPLFVPEIVTAVASLVFFVAVGIKLGMLTIIISHIVFCIPFAYLPIRARLESMDDKLEAAAADLYATPMKSFSYITLPLLVPGLISGWLLAFIISLDDFMITTMVTGPGATTLPLHIYGMLRLGMTPEVNAISSLLVLASALLVVIAGSFGFVDKR